MAPSRHDWKIVDWDVKPQHKQTNFDFRVNIGTPYTVHMTYISWWFCLNKNYLMDEHHSWYNGSVWHRDWPHQVYVGQWLIFYFASYLEVCLMEKLFLYFKNRCWSGAFFVALRALAVVFLMYFHCRILNSNYFKAFKEIWLVLIYFGIHFLSFRNKNISLTHAWTLFS